MCEVMEQLRDESIERGKEQKNAEVINFLMKKLGYTIQQAMDFLEIPVAEQGKYLAKL